MHNTSIIYGAHTTHNTVKIQLGDLTSHAIIIQPTTLEEELTVFYQIILYYACFFVIIISVHLIAIIIELANHHYLFT
jgi:hypothetical protein